MVVNVLYINITYQQYNIEKMHDSTEEMEFVSKIVESVIDKLLEVLALKDIKLAIFNN